LLLPLAWVQTLDEMVIDALKTGIQPPERTLIELTSYPSLEELSQKGLRLLRSKKESKPNFNRNIILFRSQHFRRKTALIITA
jgi:hypothetical protein